MSFSLLMFSGEKYTLYVRDNQVLSLIRSFIFLYVREVIMMGLWVYGVVVSMFDFHHSDRGSNPGRGGKIS